MSGLIRIQTVYRTLNGILRTICLVDFDFENLKITKLPSMQRVKTDKFICFDISSYENTKRSVKPDKLGYAKC